MSRIGEEILKDIEKETVDFMPNYDATKQEPVVLPSPVPQLLLNGSLGIAVGMATNIPPHNLGEVVDCAVYLIDNPEATTEDLFQFFRGPDFPTGGIIYNKKEILQAYSQGKGPILTRGKAEIKELAKEKFQIVITEIPYQVQKATLVQQFAKLVETKKIEGIKDIRDESDREGMCITIDLKKEAFPKKVLNALYKYSDLQKTFHLNMLALVDGIQPRVLSLVDVLSFYLKHKEEIVLRRTKFDLKKATERQHILLGLIKALKNIDEVIATIKKSKNKEEASNNLQKKFKLSKLQAEAILEMKLQSLAKMEREKMENELKALEELIKELESILKSKTKVKAAMKKELLEVKAKFLDDRRTKVVIGGIGEIAQEDLVPSEEALLLLTSSGYIKRMKPAAYKEQKRGGKGVVGADISEEDAVSQFLMANTLDKLLFFADSGKVFQCFVWEIPDMKRTTKGRGLLNFLEMGSEEKVLSLVPYSAEDEKAGKKYLIIATKNGIIKRTELGAFSNVRKNGLIAIKLQKGDSLCKAQIANEADEVILVTKKGQSVRFKQKDLRPMGRNASGVKGIKLSAGDEVIAMEIIKPEAEKQYLLVMSENGYSKRTKIGEYRLQKRGGSGIKTAKLTAKTGNLVFGEVVCEEIQEIIVISQKGQVIRSPLKSVSVLGRSASGVRVIRLKPNDKAASAICL